MLFLFKAKIYQKRNKNQTKYWELGLSTFSYNAHSYFLLFYFFWRRQKGNLKKEFRWNKSRHKMVFSGGLLCEIWYELTSSRKWLIIHVLDRLKIGFDGIGYSCDKTISEFQTPLIHNLDQKKVRLKDSKILFSSNVKALPSTQRHYHTIENDFTPRKLWFILINKKKNNFNR